jgi:hypothetical protein
MGKAAAFAFYSVPACHFCGAGFGKEMFHRDIIGYLALSCFFAM